MSALTALRVAKPFPPRKVVIAPATPLTDVAFATSTSIVDGAGTELAGVVEGPFECLVRCLECAEDDATAEVGGALEEATASGGRVAEGMSRIPTTTATTSRTIPLIAPLRSGGSQRSRIWRASPRRAR